MSDYTASNRSDARRDVFKGMSTKSKAKNATKNAAPTIRVGEYGRYQVKSGHIAGAYVARAFPKPPTNARGLIAEATGETEEAAIVALHSAIDAREVRRNEDRRTDPTSGTSVPSTEEYMEAIDNVNLTRPQRAMVVALSLAEADGLTEAEIAAAGSYKSLASASRSLTSAGNMIARYLSSETGAEVPSAISDGSALIGYRGASGHDERQGNWILHPELCAAIRNAR